MVLRRVNDMDAVKFAETNAEHYIVLLMATIVGDFMEEVIACEEIMSEN